MNKFLKTYNLPKLNYEDIENLNRCKTSKEVKSVIKIVPGPDGSTSDFYQHLNPSQTLPNKERREHFTTHSLNPTLP